MCGSAFAAPVWIVLDAGERPELVAELRAGTLHQTSCPRCGTPGSITAPLLYHDAERQLLLLAVPPTIESPAAAEELAEQLVGYLHEGFGEQVVPEYLYSVELVADLDGLQLVLNTPEDASGAIAAAIEATLGAVEAEEFQTQFARHRGALMLPETDAALAALVAEARAADDHAGARRLNELRATLARFRDTLNDRRAAIDELLASLELTSPEHAVMPALRTLLHAVDPQEMYAARLRLAPDEQALLDGLHDRALAAATERNSDTLEFLQAVADLREL
jgi:hypothetical protein